MTKAQVKSDLSRRDNRESKRKIDPLKPTKKSWVLDTTGIEIERVVEMICERVKEMEKR